MSGNYKPRIIMRNVRANGNGGDGVRIEGGVPVDIDGLETSGNGGIGLNVLDDLQNPEDSNSVAIDPWYKRPIGMIGLGVLTAVISAAVLWAFNHYFA